MRNIAIYGQKQRIDNLFGYAPMLAQQDSELVGHWARYLCVLCAGFIENSIKEILQEYVKGKSNVMISNYCTKTLGRIMNPKTSKILDSLNCFNEKWKDETEVFTKTNGRKEAIESIMTNRHLIAHGKNVGISIGTLKSYYGKTIEVIDFIEGKIG